MIDRQNNIYIVGETDSNDLTVKPMNFWQKLLWLMWFPLEKSKSLR